MTKQYDGLWAAVYSPSRDAMVALPCDAILEKPGAWRYQFLISSFHKSKEDAENWRNPLSHRVEFKTGSVVYHIQSPADAA